MNDSMVQENVSKCPIEILDNPKGLCVTALFNGYPQVEFIPKIQSI